MPDPQSVKLPFPSVLISAIGIAKRLIQALPQPWIAQFVLRLALAVPFGRLGVLKLRARPTASARIASRMRFQNVGTFSVGQHENFRSHT
ncbi:hypothetical protein B0G81_7648 [Paraburkholderia sp. BL6665CI2N2]|nr:hypothetical protein B0G81_7648 [Paraburkholderia sp. BL6665CI2N2]